MIDESYVVRESLEVMKKSMRDVVLIFSMMRLEEYEAFVVLSGGVVDD